MTPDLPSVQTALMAAPNWVGDVVMATPAFRALRAAVPGARLTLLVRAYARPVLRGAPWFDRVVEIRGRPRSLAAVVRTARAVRSEPPDLAVVLPHSFRSALTVWLGGARHAVGYARDSRRWLLHRAVERQPDGGPFEPMYMADYYLRLLEAAGVPSRGRELELFVTPGEEERWKALRRRCGLGPDEPLAALNPGAAWGSSKCWPPERFARAGDLLARRLGLRVAVLAGPGEEEVLRAIVSAMETPALALPAGEVPLDLLKPLVRDLRLLVTNDTGPRHVATALGTPSVVLLGPTDPAYTRNDQERALVLRSDRACAPCHLPVCPRGHECMLDIEPEQVADAAGKLLGA